MAKSKQKIILVPAGDAIKKNKLRGERRVALEAILTDADATYALRLTRDNLRRLIAHGDYLGDTEELVLVMHTIMFCASASAMDSDYAYKAVTTIETTVTSLITEPIGRSLWDNTDEYLLFRAVETLNMVLQTIKKIQTWPADAQTQLSIAALAVCFAMDKTRQKWLNDEPKGDLLFPEAPVIVASPEPVKHVGFVPSDEAYANMKIVNKTYPTATCIQVSNKLQIKVLPGGLHLSKRCSSMAEAWAQAAQRVIQMDSPVALYDPIKTKRRKDKDNATVSAETASGAGSQDPGGLSESPA